MYSVDERDRVVELRDAPQSSVGAPCPLVLASERALFLAYYLEDRRPDWDGTTVRIVGVDSIDEPAAVVRFHGVAAHMFGPPNDEAFEGHPLASRGLRPYRAFEVIDSSWVRRLAAVNSVHPQHSPSGFLSRRHFVWAFHDSTFECIARGFDVDVTRGALTELIGAGVRSLE